MKKIKIVILFLLLPSIVLAQGLIAKAKEFLRILILIVFLVSLFEIIYAGFLLVTAEGQPEKLIQAKSTLIYAIIGLGIATLAWALAKMMGSLMGVSVP